MFSGIRRGLQGHPLGDVEAEIPSRPPYLTGLLEVMSRMVGDAEVDQHLGADAVFTAVHRQTLLQVGVDGVVPLFLELVGLRIALTGVPMPLPSWPAKVDQHARYLRLR